MKEKVVINAGLVRVDPGPGGAVRYEARVDGGTQWPSRQVDAHQQGWHLSFGEDSDVYAADYGWKRNLPDRSPAELEASRGPLRPVLPVTAEDVAALRDVFGRVGRQTVTTVAAALEAVFHGLREGAGGRRAPHYSYEYARRSLMAGREGSWESEVLKQIVMFGNGLNLARPTRGADNRVEARRERGPSERVDPDGRADLAAVFARWVSDPARYTEVAETLARVVSGYADDTAGPNGWRAVADRWLQPGGLASNNFDACYRLLYSQSAHFDSGLIGRPF